MAHFKFLFRALRTHQRHKKKIHAICDALGNPTQFYFTSGEAHDLNGADALLPNLEADAVLADRAYDAQERVIDKLKEKGCEVVIPSTTRRKQQRDYDHYLYQARHLIENFFARLK